MLNIQALISAMCYAFLIPVIYLFKLGKSKKFFEKLIEEWEKVPCIYGFLYCCKGCLPRKEKVHLKSQLLCFPPPGFPDLEKLGLDLFKEKDFLWGGRI